MLQKICVRLFRRSTGSYLQLVGNWKDNQALAKYVYYKFPGWDIDLVAVKQ